MKIPNPEVIIPTVSKACRADDTAPSGLPVEQDQRREPQRDRSDEPDLHRPEQVLESAPEEGDDQRDDGPGPGTGSTTGEDVDLEDDDDMEESKERQVGHVRGQAEGPEHQPVDDGRDPEPVLVERLEKAVEA